MDVMLLSVKLATNFSILAYGSATKIKIVF